MRLHAVVDSLRLAERAVAGGATVVQLRLKGVPTETRAAIGRMLLRLPATLVINDDVAAALQCGADGVHLGQDDTGAELAIAEGLMLGLSASTVQEAKQARALGAAYIGAGPVWATPSKPDAGRPIGLPGLRRICRAVEIPVVAIGGVDAHTAAECIAVGAAGVAVVRAADDAATVRAAVDAALSVAVRSVTPERV